MIIDFNKIGETVLKKFNGGEKEVNAYIYNDEMNKIMYGKLIPSASIGLHKHETSSEIVYIIKGKGKFLFGKDDEMIEESISEGMSHYCPKGFSHSFINDSDEDIFFIAVVPKQ